MRINGIQKLTLLDYPGHTACTVFLGGCNFRCPFCHNAPLVLEPRELETLPEEDFFSFLDRRHGLLDGVCITGGEPTLSTGLFDFMRRIRSMGFLVKLDTNGSFPSAVEYIAENRLADYIAMDIKNSPEKYAMTIGIENYDPSPVIESARIIMNGGVDYEFRTTVVRQLHEPSDFESIGRWLEGAERYFLQGFVDSGNLIENGMSGCSRSEMEKMLGNVTPFIRNASIRGMD